MDDICSTMDKVTFERYISLFDELGIKALLGLVPLPLDPKLLLYDEDPLYYVRIKQLIDNGYEVAMHGCYHLLENHGGKALLTKRNDSEFAGLPLDSQIKLIENGKNELGRNGINTDVFMPPAHSFDDNTVKALLDTGFKYVTDGLSFKPYNVNGLKFIPADSSYRLHRIGLLTLCIHLNDDFGRIEKFLRNNKDNVITFSEATKYDEISVIYAHFQERLRYFVRGVISLIHNLIK